MNIIGIDPGVSGGLAYISGVGPIQTFKMPETERDLWDLIESCAADGDCFAYIEKLGGMPRGPDGRAMQSPTTMFVMGSNYGRLRMALIAAGIAFEEIAATCWQRTFQLKGPKGESRVDKKNRHKAKAQQLFPTLKITHANADALLIAEHARRERVVAESPW